MTRSVAIKKWVIVAFTLQAASTLLYALGGLVWQHEQNPFLGLSTSVSSNLTKSVWLFLLYWQINRRKNWARRLLIVYALVSLPFLPAIIASTADRWHPLRFRLLWDLAVSASTAEGIFLTAWAVFLLRPSVRSEFTQKPSPAVYRCLLAFYGPSALVTSLLVVWGTNSLNPAAKTGNPPLWLRRLADQGTDKELAQLQSETNLRIPRFGFVTKIVRKPNLWIVPMVNFQTQGTLIIAIAPGQEQIDLGKCFEELDQENARKVERASSLIQHVLQNHPNVWSRFSPTRVAEDTTGADGKDLRPARVSFPVGTQPSGGFMTKLVIRAKNIVCLSYGQGEVLKPLIAFLKELLKDNMDAARTVQGGN